jgi:ureidoacrylate peracid hydrolase
MHELRIPQAVLRQVTALRGRLHRWEKLTGAKAALLVIDMQNGFLLPGMPFEVPAGREIIPNINRLAHLVRTLGGRVVWVRMTLAAQESEWSVFFDGLAGPSAVRTMPDLFRPGSPGFELHAELDVRAEDSQIVKTRYSALHPRSSDLAKALADAGLDTVIVTGTLTNICCESTARDAMMHNFKVVFVADATATISDEEHNATLINVLRAFGDVRTTDAVIAACGRSQGTGT